MANTSHLTLKQENFVKEYIKNGGNASAAYRKAYDCSNWTENSINCQASKMLDNPKIMQRIEKHHAKVEKKFEYAVEEHFRNLAELKKLALCPNSENGKIEISAAIKAEELMGKVGGHYTQKLDLGDIKKVNITFGSKKND